ncbi:MAG: nucleoside monophosphate kinase [Candidatus Diapherotrites archaeon]
MKACLLFMGPPGSGKSTMAKKLVEEYGFVHFSTGDIIREKIANDKKFKEMFEALIREGKLLDDENTKKLLLEKLKAANINNGFILDGYPRTIKQTEDLEDVLKEIHAKLLLVLYFKLPESSAVRRLSKRLYCPKCARVYNLASVKPKKDGFCDYCNVKLEIRPDDMPDAIIKRFREYENKTRPVVEHYKKMGLLKEVDVDDEVEANYKKIKKIIKEIKLSKTKRKIVKKKKQKTK